MPHENRDVLLSLFYHEASPQEEQQMRAHLADCEDCREHMQFLNFLSSTLNRWQDERPLPDTLDRILANIPPEPRREIYVQPAVSARPIFNIAFALISILLLIYFVQSKISMLPIWPSLAQHWVIQALGSFGFVALVFLGIGAFITLSLAPVLYFDLNRKALRL